MIRLNLYQDDNISSHQHAHDEIHNDVAAAMGRRVLVKTDISPNVVAPESREMKLSVPLPATTWDIVGALHTANATFLQ